jgi:hypothetical protein
MEKESISRLLNGSATESPTFVSMDQSSIVVFLRLKGLSDKAKDVHTELVKVLGYDAMACSTLTKYRRNNVISQEACQ